MMGFSKLSSDSECAFTLVQQSSSVQDSCRFIYTTELTTFFIVGQGFIATADAKTLTKMIEFHAKYNNNCVNLVIDLSKVANNSGKYARIIDAINTFNKFFIEKNGKISLIVNKHAWESELPSLIEDAILPDNKDEYPFPIKDVDSPEDINTVGKTHTYACNTKRIDTAAQPTDLPQGLRGYEFNVIDVLPHSVLISLSDANGRKFPILVKRDLLSIKQLDVPGATGVFFAQDNSDGSITWSEAYFISKPDTTNTPVKSELLSFLVSVETAINPND